jgi:RNA-directed DNA polymerase
MNSLQFEKSQFRYFCAIIGFKPQKIEKIIEDIDSYYNEWFVKKPDKKNGGYKKYQDGTEKIRPIRPSLKELKIVQKAIKNRILVPIKLPDNIHGGVNKRSNITNAKPHQGNKYQFTTDLNSFYPSIKHDRIFDAFLSLGFTNHFSYWLTKLTSWKYELPQGTPTSTHIANLVFLKTDYQLVDFCNKHNIEYTRYVDDLTFSSPKCFKHLLNDILEIVITNDFKISYRKTKYEGNQNITGIDVYNNFVDAPDRIRLESQKELRIQDGYQPYTNYLENIRKTNKRKTAANKSNRCTSP